jgi:hypothetical protein
LLVVAPVTIAAMPPVKSPSAKVTVRLAISSALACAVALPVRLRVAVVALALTREAVRPAGTLVTAPREAPLAPVKVSPVSVMVLVAVMEPSLAVASVKVLVL